MSRVIRVTEEDGSQWVEAEAYDRLFELVSADLHGTFFDDVGAFHEKFGLPVAGGDICQPMGREDEDYRIKFLEEELSEFKLACRAGNVPDMLDALVDLAWVAMGTAHYLGAPFGEAWAEVARANMEKVRVENDPNKPYRRPGAVVKPPGWAPPDIAGVVARHNTALYRLDTRRAGSGE